MRVEGYENVWALGDIAAVPDPGRRGHPWPPTAQHAMRQGKLMANNVAAALGHRPQAAGAPAAARGEADPQRDARDEEGSSAARAWTTAKR